MNENSQSEATRTIVSLNDSFRRTFIGGSVLVTAGMQALGGNFVANALAAVRNYDAFSLDDDPYLEHDFGCLNVNGHKLFWKMDYYDPSMEYGSQDPSNPNVTRRVLTIMLAEEY